MPLKKLPYMSRIVNHRHAWLNINKEKYLQRSEEFGNALIGGYDLSHSGNFIWLDGQPWTNFSNTLWAPGQPNNTCSAECYCTLYYANNNSRFCSYPYYIH